MIFNKYSIVYNKTERSFGKQDSSTIEKFKPTDGTNHFQH